MYKIPTSFGVQALSSENPNYNGVPVQIQCARVQYHSHKMYTQNPDKKYTDTHHMD
jgi:hypothetical protein